MEGRNLPVLSIVLKRHVWELQEEFAKQYNNHSDSKIAEDKCNWYVSWSQF